MSVVLIAIFGLALIGLIWCEIRRIPNHRRGLRMGAVVLALVSMLLLTRTPESESHLNVLTPGAPAAARTRDAVWLSDFASPALLWNGRRAERTIHLAGWGLLTDEWPDSLISTVTLTPAPLPRGIIVLASPTETGLGELLVISGQLNLGPTDSAWVCLDDPAGPRDSVRVGGQSPTFRVSDWPRAATRAEYRLRVREGAVTFSVDTVGVAVRVTRPPTILVLDGSPSFESTYLKRWLADHGGGVTVRTTLSRDRYRTDRVNQKGGSLDRLSSRTFAAYDAVLVDGRAVMALAPTELSALRQAVTRDGLGLLITADVAAAAATELSRGIATAAASGAEELSVKPVWTEIPRRSPVTILASPATLNPQMQTLVRDGQGRVLAAQQSAGAGRIGATLLRTPSRWVLEGEEDLFAGYWQLLLTAVARDTVTRVAVSADGPMRSNRAVQLAITIPRVQEKIGESWPLVTVIGPDQVVDTIALARDAFDPRHWSGRYWPRTAGWHTLDLVGGRSVPFRVTHDKEWVGLEAAARRLASAARLGTSAVSEPVLSAVWWRLGLFLLIVALLTGLWIEPRIGR